MVSNDQLAARLARSNERLCNMDKALKEIAKAVAEIPAMREDIAATKDIVEAWQAAKTAGKFIKWTGGISAAIAAFVLLAKTGAATFLARF